MKVRLEQMNPVVGELDRNVGRILEVMKQADEERVDLLILPEMAVTGYPPMDLLESPDFREAVYRANRLLTESSGEATTIFGTVTASDRKYGPALYNSALVCRNAEVTGRIHKTLLPTYDIFDEKRYFAENRSFRCIEAGGVRLGITICEDIWHNENETGDPVYEADPAAELMRCGAQALINISASPYTRRKPDNRREVLQKQASRLGVPLFYTNQVGGQTDILFDGDAQVIGADGGRVVAARPFIEGRIDVEWDPESGIVAPLSGSSAAYPTDMERLFEGILMGIRDYVGKSGAADSVMLGLSGGIDSALVAVLAAEALGADRVSALAMPTRFSSSGSVDDSSQLAKNLGIGMQTLPLQDLYETALSSLAPLFEDLPFGVAEENLQSRLRGTLLMACANKFGRLLLTTGNKSELAVGYATLYGDMNGALNPIGDLYKTEVYRLSRWINETYYGREVIPAAILEKPPSAELRPGQRDQDSLPPYDSLDDILYRYIERREGLAQIASEGGHGRELVASILQLVDRNEFKRYQAPPILKVSSKAFGPGRRWPLVQGWTRHCERERNAGGQENSLFH